MPYSQPAPTVQPLCHLGLTARARRRTDRVDNRETIVHAGMAALDVEEVVLNGKAGAADDGREHVGAPGEHVVSGTERVIRERALVVRPEIVPSMPNT